jgi:transaldolase
VDRGEGGGAIQTLCLANCSSNGTGRPDESHGPVPANLQSNGVDGWVSLEVSPLLAHDTGKTLAAAIELHAHAARPNLFIKKPGTKEGLPAIEEAIFKGVPINVTLLFSREHYLAAAEAFLRGIERRMDAGLNPNVDSVASLFISRWYAAITARVPEAMRNKIRYFNSFEFFDHTLLRSVR